MHRFSDFLGDHADDAGLQPFVVLNGAADCLLVRIVITGHCTGERELDSGRSTGVSAMGSSSAGS